MSTEPAPGPQVRACCHGSEASAPAAAPSSARSTAAGVWLRVGIALVIAGQSMMFGMGFNLAEEPPAYGSTTYTFLHGGLILSTLVVFALLGPRLLRESAKAVRARRISIEALFLLGILGAFGGSLVSTFTGQQEVYYEVVAVLLAVYTVGSQLASSSREKALREARRLREEYEWAWLLGENEQTHRVPVSELCTHSSRVVVRPGEAVTVDGTIVEGSGYLRETPLTGEPAPVAKGPGDTVYAGTHALDGRLLVQPRALSGERRIDRVLDTVENAPQARPSAFQEQADRLLKIFVPTVVVVCLGTFAVWMLVPGVPWWRALFHALAVLLIACPCALGLATPMAVWGALVRLSSLGMVARSGSFIEGLAGTERILFDKTGTLSEDGLVLTAVHAASGMDEARVRALVGAVEAEVEHPVARALAAPAAGVEVARLRTLSGKGVEATVREHGPEVTVRIGEVAFAGEGDRESMALLADLHRAAGKKVVAVSVDGRTAAILLLDEKLRAGTVELFDELRALGVESEILTGDPHPRLRELPGVEVRAGLAPEEKAERVRALQAEDRQLLFVGDGINDAGAMALCPVSLAMGEGTPLARTTATAVLPGESLRLLPKAVELCRRVRRSLRGNLIFAFSYNVAGMAIAAAGLLHPVAAALLMVGSSLLVSARALSAARLPRELDPDLPQAAPQAAPQVVEGARH